jgi:large subunit ribosomal protein L17
MPRPARARASAVSPHEKKILANLATSLIWEGKVETTTGQGQGGAALAEKMITKAQGRTLHARRMVLLRTIDVDTEVVTKLFDEVAPEVTPSGPAATPGSFEARWPRPRRGDGAEMAVIELV